MIFRSLVNRGTLLWCFLLCFIVMTGWAMLIVEIVYPAVKDGACPGSLDVDPFTIHDPSTGLWGRMRCRFKQKGLWHSLWMYDLYIYIYIYILKSLESWITYWYIYIYLLVYTNILIYSHIYIYSYIWAINLSNFLCHRPPPECHRFATRLELSESSPDLNGS